MFLPPIFAQSKEWFCSYLRTSPIFCFYFRTGTKSSDTAPEFDNWLFKRVLWSFKILNIVSLFLWHLSFSSFPLLWTLIELDLKNQNVPFFLQSSMCKFSNLWYTDFHIFRFLNICDEIILNMDIEKDFWSFFIRKRKAQLSSTLPNLQVYPSEAGSQLGWSLTVGWHVNSPRNTGFSTARAAAKTASILWFYSGSAGGKSIRTPFLYWTYTHAHKQATKKVIGVQPLTLGYSLILENGDLHQQQQNNSRGAVCIKEESKTLNLWILGSKWVTVTLHCKFLRKSNQLTSEI